MFWHTPSSFAGDKLERHNIGHAVHNLELRLHNLKMKKWKILQARRIDDLRYLFFKNILVQVLVLREILFLISTAIY